MKKNMFGMWAFWVAFGGALLLGLLAFFNVLALGTGVIILFVAGVIAGFLNISRDESTKFMVSVLILGGSAGVLALLPIGGAFLTIMATSMVSAMLPMGMVVAIKQMVSTGRK